MIFLLPLILFLFFILTQVYIWEKSKIFWLFYCVLFAYTIFTQLAYLLYPEKLTKVSHFQYYGDSIFIKYWIFIFLSFIFIFLLFSIFYDKKLKIIHLELKKPRKSKNFLYITIILIYESILLFFLIKNFNNLSYYNQYILKGNKLWFYLLSFNSIIFLSLLYKIFKEKRRLKKIFIILFIFSLLVLVATCIRAGQRSEFFLAFMGILAFFLYLYKNKKINKKIKLKNILIFLFIIIVVISLLQGVRKTRGREETLNNFLSTIKNPQIFLTLLIPENVIFQDWVAPSLTLATSINYKTIFPLEVVKSNLFCSIPLINHKSLGLILSRIIHPQGTQGFGYYILTEGYNIMGFFGFIYISFIFVFAIKILDVFFTNTKDKYINAFMCGIMGFLAISLVRGQSVVLFRSLYYYFIPAILLLRLMGIKFYLKR